MFVILLVLPVIVRLSNISIFMYIFSSVVSIVWNSFLCRLFSSCHCHYVLVVVDHTNLVSFVIFPSFLLALFVIRFGFLAAIFSCLCALCFQRIASKCANNLDEVKLRQNLTNGVQVM